MGSEEWPAAYGKGQQWLPPGFRFHPTDEELVICYLAKKVQNEAFTDPAIAEVDLNKCEPWDLPARAKMGEREWYFYSLLDRKYPTGMRTNRATVAGYWKATGKDREVMSTRTNTLVGMKKTLVFYRGRAPKGEKTNWVMHEYRLEGNTNFSRTTKEERVVCRVFQKNMGATKNIPLDYRRTHLDYTSSSSSSLPPLLDSPHLPVSKGAYPQGEYETFANYLPFMRSAAYDQGLAEPTFGRDEGESNFTKCSSSYLQTNLSNNSHASTTTCITKDADNHHQPWNTIQQMAGDALNLDVTLPWLSTNMPSNAILKALMDHCNAGDGDVKPNFVSNKVQPKVSEAGFLLEDLLHSYNELPSPSSNYQKQPEQQEQIHEAVPSHLSQEENNIPIHCQGQVSEPNLSNSRLNRLTSGVDLENLWEF